MELFSSWTGSDFLLFYTGLLGIGTLAAWRIPALLRAQGQRGESPDFEAIALLESGPAGHADSVIVDLFARNALKAADGKLHVVQASVPASPAGRALLAAREPFTRNQATAMLAIHASRIIARLRREGLLLRAEELNRLRLIALIPFAAIFLIGLYRQRAGAAEGEPTGFLIGLMVLTFVVAVIRLTTIDKRTGAAIDMIADLKRRNARLRRAPREDETAMAVALFGTGVLVGTPWQPVHALRQKDSSGDGGGDGGDGGGCGGGGCGGCGG